MTGGALPVIKSQEYRMHKGSHHLLLYAYFGPHPERLGRTATSPASRGQLP